MQYKAKTMYHFGVKMLMKKEWFFALFKSSLHFYYADVDIANFSQEFVFIHSVDLGNKISKVEKTFPYLAEVNLLYLIASFTGAGRDGHTG